MKKALILLTITLAIPLVFNSCSKDEDSDPTANFVGSWDVDEEYTVPGWGTMTDSYSITITKSSTGSSTILISNFANIDETVTATVSGNTMTITSQSVDWDGDLVTVSGSGTLSGSTLSFSYNIPDFWTGECTATKL
jgi:hypothetical protein